MFCLLLRTHSSFAERLGSRGKRSTNIPYIRRLGKYHSNDKRTVMSAFTTSVPSFRKSTMNTNLPSRTKIISGSTISTTTTTSSSSSFIPSITSPSSSFLYHDYPNRRQRLEFPRLYSSQQPQQSTKTTTTTTTSSSSSPNELLSLSDPATYTLPDPSIQGGSIQYASTIPKGQRIVTFGDVHGDIDALRNFLLAAKLLDPNSPMSSPKWIGGNTIVVQCGDILDRGNEELGCLAALASLARQAHDHGGQFHILYGNHESLNAVGLFQYANAGGNVEIDSNLGKALDRERGGPMWRLQFAGNQPSRWMAFQPGGMLSKPLLIHLNVCVLIGRTVFVHAGLTGEHLREYGGIEGMNAQAREWMLLQKEDDMDKAGKEKGDKGQFESVKEVIEYAQNKARRQSSTMPPCLGGGIGATSPVWMRDYSTPADMPPKNVKAQQMIDDCLNELGNGVQRMVMGHTPQSRINSALGGKAWRIDVGASKGVLSGTPEVLEIIHGGAKNGEQDLVNILTMSGESIPAKDRETLEPFF